ncbi:MAG: bifunctional folylpolyglutamate synthase/dihydrofolate synthase [Lachnospiraceae bacterium]|nr:bifunctional folylpolyglutamate synthase/dihydrofolate synthase [Eubacterium sp.]MBQ5559734.1 bifunctional folylpolyglutamate synthase/dihydrofolate synthase [Lachnospiraceae bacterium]
MNYQETVEYLNHLPVFQPSKVKSGEQIMGLDSIRVLLERLEHPERKLRCIHVGGTNGKGSTVAFLRRILLEAGYKVGSFQSPAIDHLREQIQLNQKDIPEEAFARAMTRIRREVEFMAENHLGLPTMFEMIVTAALLYFLEEQTDFVILEVGLGGDIDATNVIPTPELAILTTISYDHMELLGNTLSEIARHKAGIIKEGGLVLTYPQEEEVMEVLIDKCRQVGATLITASLPEAAIRYDLEGQEFDTERLKNLHIGLLGTYQIRNAAVAVKAVELLNRTLHGEMKISDDAIRAGLWKTEWPARFQLISKNPYIIVDGGHNMQGIEMLKDSLIRYFPNQKIRFVTGVLADKEYKKMMNVIMPISKRFYTITPENPRALEAKQLAEYLKSIGGDAVSCDTLDEAMRRARKDTLQHEVICVFGSLYFVGKVCRNCVDIVHN